MKDKKSTYRDIPYSEKVLYDIVQSTLEENIETCVDKVIGDNWSLEVSNFHKEYSHKYRKLKKNVDEALVDFGTSTTDFTLSEAEMERINQTINHVKFEVLTPTYEELGAEVLEASHSPQALVELMRRKRVKNEEFQHIVSSLVKWQILDELQQQLQPMDFSRCFEGFHESPGLGGRPEENLYDRVDKHRLRLTLEALHHERYSMTVKQGWLHSQARTKQFLLAFMLSLFKDLYGKMAAFHRFFTEVCGYTFIKTARTLQNWLSAYQEFVNERSRRTDRDPQCEPQASHDRWMRQERKYTLVEELAKWMRGLLPHYGVSMA